MKGGTRGVADASSNELDDFDINDADSIFNVAGRYASQV